MMATRTGSWDNGPETTPNRSRGEKGENTFGSDLPLFDKARQRAEEWYGGLGLQRRVEQHPVGMLAAAWGIGFVLGGGLTTTLARRALEMGARVGVRLLIPVLMEKAWQFARKQGNASSRTSGAASVHE